MLILLSIFQEILSLERRQTKAKAAVAGIHHLSLQELLNTRYVGDLVNERSREVGPWEMDLMFRS